MFVIAVAAIGRNRTARSKIAFVGIVIIGNILLDFMMNFGLGSMTHPFRVG